MQKQTEGKQRRKALRIILCVLLLLALAAALLARVIWVGADHRGRYYIASLPEGELFFGDSRRTVLRKCGLRQMREEQLQDTTFTAYSGETTVFFGEQNACPAQIFLIFGEGILAEGYLFEAYITVDTGSPEEARRVFDEAKEALFSKYSEEEARSVKDIGDAEKGENGIVLALDFGATAVEIEIKTDRNSVLIRGYETR